MATSLLIWILAPLLTVVVYAVFPRFPDLTRFDPDTMGSLEAAMWRHYYDRKYFYLLLALYHTSRHVNFSPASSLFLSLQAARAARRFQSSKSREGAQRALRPLSSYFRTLSTASPNSFSPEDAAHTELEWWQARREAVAPEEYGLTIARVAGMLYGKDNVLLKKAGIARAQAMTFRDRLKAKVTEEDWEIINRDLATSYSLLKRAIHTRTGVSELPRHSNSEILD
jgi:hypothetical protein